MIRKQYLLPEDLARKLAVAAKQQGKHESAIVREAITEKIRQSRQMTAGEALLGLAKLGKELGIHGPPDLSSRIDDYLYGDES